MHLLSNAVLDRTSSYTISDQGAVDLGQTPGEVVVLTTADSELSALSAAHKCTNIFTLRLANLLRLGHPLSVDLYKERIIKLSRLVIVRLLGGRSYWPYGVEQVAETCRSFAIPVAFLPGDSHPDVDLSDLSTLPEVAVKRLWDYMIHGGIVNAEQFLRYAATLIGYKVSWQEPSPLAHAGLVAELSTAKTVVSDSSKESRLQPTAAIVFYRSLAQAGNTEVIRDLTNALAKEGITTLALFVTSLKDPMAVSVVQRTLVHFCPDVIINATGFAFTTFHGQGQYISDPLYPAESYAREDTFLYSKTKTETKFNPFDGTDCPILQVVMSGSNINEWRESQAGLSARDLVMNVVMPELDGRILTRAVAFKNNIFYDSDTECNIVTFQPVPDRIAFVAKLAARWISLRRAPVESRRITLILSNYPNKDGRVGNGVGLDTPASVISMLNALAQAGYYTGTLPSSGQELIERLLSGPTNNAIVSANKLTIVRLRLDDYKSFLSLQPNEMLEHVRERWGEPESDPFVHEQYFSLPIIQLGNVTVAIQPSRGYHIDPISTYHDPALVPPHRYLAFYSWIRDVFCAHAIVHVGKHGNVEWLPGKAVALSDNCFPEVSLGPIPNLYPFIVNDPGEGTQAKRRTAAVIIDHLTPPLTRAESYGSLCKLESLIDEYYEAQGMDIRRCETIKTDILSLVRVTRLDLDLNIASLDDSSTLVKLDNYLCTLKELQIRDGLHVFGQSPDSNRRRDLLIAIARSPRGNSPHEISLLQALAMDLGLAFDPLDALYAQPWTGQRPVVLYNIMPSSPWRTTGDTIERLEELAKAIIDGTTTVDQSWVRTVPVMLWITNTLAPTVDACGSSELLNLLCGLEGKFVIPGPSGAPSRGRPDVLPTGRNFYSVDTRTLPTQAAWTLGWESATKLLERHLQEHGNWPRSIALTAWGTSNMRTGGDDIAQGLALMGVRPSWELTSRRVIGFKIIPITELNRPRIDVVLRISGFFRDAFPSLIDLFDSAVLEISKLEEPEEVSPLAEHVRIDTSRLAKTGLTPEVAARQARYRVFGSKPGSYGAGLQVLIDEKCWTTDADLARAYIEWGGYAYGVGTSGLETPDLFANRLQNVDTIVQNQDNREHDLLDSDDYYQFEGGITAAVRQLSGRVPTVYHTDHSRIQSPKILTLKEEIARVVRGRAANPKWIRGVMRHGYKGAFEIAATVDYLFAFAATTLCVENHHFDLLFEAYLADESVRTFMAESNPNALHEMSDRFEEALTRNLWKPYRNDVQSTLTEIKDHKILP